MRFIVLQICLMVNNLYECWLVVLQICLQNMVKLSCFCAVFCFKFARYCGFTSHSIAKFLPTNSQKFHKFANNSFYLKFHSKCNSHSKLSVGLMVLICLCSAIKSLYTTNLDYTTRLNYKSCG